MFILVYGHNISTEINTMLTLNPSAEDMCKTVAYEARILKALLLEIIE